MQLTLRLSARPNLLRTPNRRRCGARFATLRPSQLRASAADAGLMVPAATRLSQRYSELTLPIAVIAGDGDKVAFPDNQARRLHAEISHSELAMQPGVGHMAHYGDQNEIMAAIDRLQAAA